MFGDELIDKILVGLIITGVGFFVILAPSLSMWSNLTPGEQLAKCFIFIAAVCGGYVGWHEYYSKAKKKSDKEKKG